MSPGPGSSPETIAALRRLIGVVWGIGAAGALLDLVLLEHYEDVWQMVPLGLLALSAGVFAWSAVIASRAALRAFQVTMLLCLASGAVGVVLHYRANREFQLEIDPGMNGPELFWKVVHAKAPPALAPGVMVQLALFGLLFTYQHPGLARDIGREGGRR
jgi:hypothetical protein